MSHFREELGFGAILAMEAVLTWQVKEKKGRCERGCGGLTLGGLGRCQDFRVLTCDRANVLCFAASAILKFTSLERIHTFLGQILVTPSQPTTKCSHRRSFLPLLPKLLETSNAQPNMATFTTTQPPTNILAPKPTNPPAKPTERTRTYKDFLTAALHHRFRRACYLVFAACFLASLLLRWDWLSFTAIRPLLLFLPCLAVFIVRVANMHFGRQNTRSVAEGLYKALTSWKTAHTVGWYVYSAWFFGEVYLWSRTEGANLGWVDQGRRYEGGLWERPMLNENPVFLRAVWVCLAVAQAGVHLWRGADRIGVPEEEEAAAKTKPREESAYKVPASLQELGGRAPTILGHILRLLIPGIALTLPLYLLFIRHLIWPYFHTIGRIFFSQLPDHSRPTGLQHQMQLSWQALSSSFTLILLWELSNAVFTIFVSRPPLRREQPLTSEVKDGHGNVVNRSKDPNGSLLSGLKSKKEVTKSFAFWELWLICSQFEPRRKTIYTEVDRAGGSTWSQISQHCLDEISAIQIRIKDVQTPSPPPAQKIQQDPLTQQSQPQQQPPIGLPKIADRHVVQNGDVFAKPHNPDFAHRVGDMAKSIGQNPNAAHAVQTRARKAIEWSADRVLTKEEQQRLSRQGLTQEASGMVVKFLRSPVGEPLRRTFGRRVKSVVLGGVPDGRSRRVDVVFASQALSILCVHSLKEDDYGQVARSVPTILRTYTAVINDIARFMAGLEPSWTDVYFQESDRRVREVEEVLDVLKAGLEGLLLVFGEYADAVGVSKKELREAREAVGRGVEMEMRERVGR